MSRQAPELWPIGPLVSALSWIEIRLIGIGRTLLDRHQYLAAVIAMVWATYIRLYVRARLYLRSLRHAPEIGVAPFETVPIDPAAVEFMTRDSSLPGRRKYKRVGAVLDGEWDRQGVRFTDTDLYQAFEAHFEAGEAWPETDFYDRIVREIEAGHDRWGCTSQAEFDARCDRLDRLYESMAEHGYVTQAELARGKVEDPIPNDRLSEVDQFIYDEMTVNVGRDGELLLGDGRDRLAIAKLLDLDEVAVQILVRHAEWQRLLDAVAQRPNGCDELPSRLVDHPDLRGYCTEVD